MAQSNPTWGEERIADELLLKIGIQISPRTVRRYMPEAPRRPADPRQRWMTFVRNHAKAIIASDFFVVVTATFQLVAELIETAAEDPRALVAEYGTVKAALPEVGRRIVEISHELRKDEMIKRRRARPRK
jgi:hypothetical protein